MVDIHVTESQRDALNAVSRQAIGRVALRAHMVLLSDRGFTVPQIAAIHACGQDVVLTWLHRYEQQGIAGLEDEPRSGRPPKDRLAGEIVDAQASQSPPCSGHVQSGLRVALLTALPLPALSPVPLVLLGPSLPAPDGLALGPSTTGSCSQTRPSTRGETDRPGPGASASQARAGPSAVPGRI